MATQVAGVFSHFDKGDSKEYSIASSAYGYCETAAATAAKVVDMTGFELKKGVTIYVKFQFANSAANPTLNVNGTGAKPIYRFGTTAVSTNASTNGWSAGAVLALTYDGAGWIEHYWADANTTDITNLYEGSAAFVAKSAVYRYQLLFQTDENTLTPLNNANNDVGTSKTMLTGVDFMPFGKIYYYNSTTNIAANGNMTTALYYHRNGINLCYTFNCGQTLTAHRDIYLKCAKQSNGMFRIVSGTCWAQSLPSSNDGYYYLLLGRTYSTYQMELYTDHPIYYHNGSKVAQYTQIEASTTTVGSASAGTAIKAHNIGAWDAGSVPTLTYDAVNKAIVFTSGTKPSLSYTEKTIPNISVSNKTVVTGITVAS